MLVVSSKNPTWLGLAAPWTLDLRPSAFDLGLSTLDPRLSIFDLHPLPLQLSDSVIVVTRLDRSYEPESTIAIGDDARPDRRDSCVKANSFAKNPFFVGSWTFLASTKGPAMHH